MCAAVFHEAGRPLTIEQVDDPVPAPGDVVIAVERASYRALQSSNQPELEEYQWLM